MRTFRVADIDTAAYVLAKGGQVVRTELAGRTCVFLFDNEDNLAADLFYEWHGEAPMVNAREYADCRREALHEMHRLQDEAGEYSATRIAAAKERARDRFTVGSARRERTDGEHVRNNQPLPRGVSHSTRR